MNRFLISYFGLEAPSDFEDDALAEVNDCCEKVLHEKKIVDLSPQSSYIRRQQHQLVQKLGLNSISSGTEPNRRVRIYPKTDD